MPKSVSLPVTARFTLGPTLGPSPRPPIRFCVAVDFDGVLARPAWPKVGEEMPGAMSFLKWLEARDFDRVLWTCRSDALLLDALSWLGRRGFPRPWWAEVNGTPEPIRDYYGNDTRKIGCHALVDDRAIGFPTLSGGHDPDWPRIQSELETRAAEWLRHA